MPTSLETLATPVIVGRSSSHFTRVTRIFAAELGVDYSLRVVRDLMSENPDDYGGNPALRLPALETPQGTWFGALNICRELSRQSSQGARITWPEELELPLLANIQELVLQAMATEVGLIMAKAGGAGESNHQRKMRASLTNSVAWLEANTAPALAALPSNRDLSYFEVTLFCLVTHLDFRDVLAMAPYPSLSAFCRSYAERPSSTATAYRFDT